MRVKVLLAALLMTSACATQASVAPSPGPFRFAGTISVMEGQRVGAPIAGAELKVVEGANSSATVTTDAGGHYEFQGLDSGRFVVRIQAPGFVSATPVVDLYRDIEVNFALTRE